MNRIVIGFAVDVLVEIEDVHFEGKFGVAEGGIVAEVGGSAVPFAVDFCFDDIDAGAGRGLRRHADIGGRKPEGDSSLSSGNDGAGDFEKSPEKLVGLLDVAL